MDYKYIEQLLQNYWDCQTTLQEELILRTFFQQEDLPAHLQRYRSLFAAEEEMAQAKLSADFEQRMQELVDEPQTIFRARRISLFSRMKPFFRAAGMLAVILTIALAVQRTFEMEQERTEQRMADEETSPDESDAFTPQATQQVAAQSASQESDTLNSVPVQ